MDFCSGKRMFGKQRLDATSAKLLLKDPDGCEADAETLAYRAHDRLLIVEAIATLHRDVPANEGPDTPVGQPRVQDAIVLRQVPWCGGLAVAFEVFGAGK